MNRLDQKKHDDVEGNAALENKLLKFQESAWKTLLYTALASVSAYALSKEVFWRNTAEFWTGCENSLPCKYEASNEVKFAYALGFGFYMYGLPYLILFEVKRKDFWAMTAHHVATLILIGYSFLMGWTKVGVVIMFLHDICDPFLEMAKIAKYVNREALTNVLFVMLLVMWTGMRCVYFPFWVNRSVLFEGYEIAVGAGNKLAFPHYQVLASMLVFLQCLQFFWVYLIFQIAYKAVTSSSLTDIREDGDDDDSG
jgi:TLC domain